MTGRRKLMLGCVLAPIGLALLLLAAGAVLVLLPAPAVRPTVVEEQVPLGAGGTDPGAVARTGEIVPGRRRLSIELEEGEFEIVPAPGEREVRLEATYDAGSYRLDLEVTMEIRLGDGRLRLPDGIAWRSPTSAAFWRRSARSVPTPHSRRPPHSTWWREPRSAASTSADRPASHAVCWPGPIRGV